MAHAFQRLDLVMVLETGQKCWTWWESETDDYTGCMLMMKPRVLLTLPELGFSEVIFVDSTHDRDAN